MTVIPTGYAQSNLVFGGSAAPTGAEVTLGHDISAFPGTAADAADAIGDAFALTIMPALSNQLFLSVTRVKFGPAATGPSGEAVTASTGGDGQAGASPAVSYLARKLTSFGGRAGSGRMYLPGVVEPAVNVAGGVDSVKLGELEDGFVSFLNLLETANLPAVLLHDVGSPLTTPTPITSITPDATVATQRRRQRR